jgi:hypothetical protein
MQWGGGWKVGKRKGEKGGNIICDKKGKKGKWKIKGNELAYHWGQGSFSTGDGEGT